MDDTYKFACEYCSQRLRVTPQHAGISISCPGCQRSIIVPQPPSPSPEPVLMSVPATNTTTSSVAIPELRLPTQFGGDGEIHEEEAQPNIPQSPIELAEHLRRSLIERRIEQIDFERLRNKLFQYCPEVEKELTDCDSQLHLYEDPLGFEYSFIGENTHRQKTETGFRGGFFISRDLINRIAFRTFLTHVDYTYPSNVMQWLDETQEATSSMVHTSWTDAIIYCRWLSVTSNQLFTLPFREEWIFAGEALENSWGTTTPLSTAAQKWQPPGMESYGKLSDGSPGPGQTGKLWEWCIDKASVHGDARLICSGVWPNVNSAQVGTSVRQHAVQAEKRVAAAGFRPIVIPDAWLWRTNRGLISAARDASPLTQFFQAAANLDHVPGGPSRPNERPPFYHGLPQLLKARVDAVLDLLLQIDAYRPESIALPTRSRFDEPEVTGVTAFSVTKIKPVAERKLDDDDFEDRSPTETNVKIDPALFAEIEQEQKAAESSIRTIFNRLRGK